jgi:predicted dehydrogenase
MSLKVALVGCGKIADGHIEEIQKLPAKARVVAVCDLEKLMAEQISLRYGIPAHYDNVDRLLEVEKPDVVHITTPPSSHLALAVRCIDAGCHVFVEKPLAPNHIEAQRILDYARSHDSKLTVGYTYYFDPPALAMRDLIAAGVLGDPVHVEAFYGYDLGGPFGAAIMSSADHWVHRLPGRLIQNNIDHLLYRLTEFITEEQPSIHAFGYARRSKRYGDHRDGLVDELRIVLRGGNTTAYGTFSSHARPAGHFVRIYGTRNTIHVNYSTRTLTLDPTSSLPGAIGRLMPAFSLAKRHFKQGLGNVRRFARADFQFFAGLNRLLSLYYDSILNDTEPPIAYGEMLRISAIMDEIFRQVDQQGSGPST